MGYRNAQNVVVTLQTAKAITTTGGETGVDISQYEGIGHLIFTAKSDAGTSPTLTMKIEQSANNTDWDATPVNTFTQVTTSGSVQSYQVNVNNLKKYIRVYNTVGGTDSPEYYSTCVLVIAKKSA